MNTPNSTVSDERLAEMIADFSEYPECVDELNAFRELQSTRSLSTGTDAGVRVKPLVDYLWQEICELPDRSSPEDMPDAGIVTLPELTAIVETYAERSTLEQQPAASQEGDGTGVVGECRYCANTGWFYGDPDLGTYCGCDFGKLRETLSTSTSKGEVSEEMVERAVDAYGMTKMVVGPHRAKMRAAITAAINPKVSP